MTEFQIISTLLGVIGFLIILALGMFKWYWNDKVKRDNDKVKRDDVFGNMMIEELSDLKVGQAMAKVTHAEINGKVCSIAKDQGEIKKDIKNLYSRTEENGKAIERLK